MGLPALLGALVTNAVPAAAHVPALRGRLVELVQRSDCVVIGVTERVTPVTARVIEITIRIDGTIIGTPPQSPLTFRGRTRFAPGERYVIFLRRISGGFEGVQDAGTVFPAMPGDDALYRQTVTGIATALHGDASLRATQLCAAFIPALSANASPLRYHAALELSALQHTGYRFNATEQARLVALRTNASTDPALQPMLADLVRQPER